MEAKLIEGIKMIHEEFITNVIEYLKTGIFNQPKLKKTMDAYS
jgi:hypothetical protein